MLHPGIDLPRAASRGDIQAAKQAGVYAEADSLEDLCAMSGALQAAKKKAALRASGM